MSTVPFFWVDAFTDRRFGGNPAGVCLLDGPADERWMQGLAFELGLSETAYVWPEGDVLSLRWFTPTVEVDLCGHATVAAAQALREADRAADGDVLRFTTRSGLVAARLDEALIELDFPSLPPDPVEPPAALAAAWPVVAAAVGGGGGGGGDGGGGGGDLLVELESATAVATVVPDLPAIASLPYRLVAVTAAGGGTVDTAAGGGTVDTAAGGGTVDTAAGAGAARGADYVLRVFGPRVGVAEDPVTGSAQCVLGPYWAGRLGRTVLQAAQLSDRVGRLRVTVDGSRVRVAGGAVTVLRGTVTGP